MAYIAFHDFGGATAARQPCFVPPVADPIPAGDARLTDLEWRVVEVARKDGRSTLRPPGPVTTALRLLFGRPNPMLTDPRLEALRRIAVLTWQRGYSVPPFEVRAFLDAGFTSRQYETMADQIGAARIVAPTADRRSSSESGLSIRDDMVVAPSSG